MIHLQNSLKPLFLSVYCRPGIAFESPSERVWLFRYKILSFNWKKKLKGFINWNKASKIPQKFFCIFKSFSRWEKYAEVFFGNTDYFFCPDDVLFWEMSHVPQYWTFCSKLNSNLYHYKLKIISTSKQNYNSKF